MKQVTATLEWHHYCPTCERSCLTRFSGSDDEWRTTCSDCGTKYEVHPMMPFVEVSDVCDCGDLFPESGYCKYCGARR